MTTKVAVRRQMVKLICSIRKNEMRCSYCTKHNVLYEVSLQHQHRLKVCVCKILKFPLHSTRAIAVPTVCVSPSRRFAVVARVLICGWEASLKRQPQWQKRKYSFYTVSNVKNLLRNNYYIDGHHGHLTEYHMH
jgi:hypothetical protein